MDKEIITVLKELKRELGIVKSSMVTKDEFKQVTSSMVTKDEFRKVTSSMVTKSDLPKFREEITEDISEVMTELLELLDKRKADKIHVSLIDARITQIETKLTA